jgi:hypothetical protein
LTWKLLSSRELPSHRSSMELTSVHLKRRPFPVQLTFAMTINRPWGQSVSSGKCKFTFLTFLTCDKLKKYNFRLLGTRQVCYLYDTFFTFTILFLLVPYFFYLYNTFFCEFTFLMHVLFGLVKKVFQQVEDLSFYAFFSFFVKKLKKAKKSILTFS